VRITDPARIDRYYAALLARNAEYLGSFFAGVTSTGIFCLPTCRARKPRKENVEFYSGFKDALAAGFRPCKICRPTENAHSAPAPVRAAIRLLHSRMPERLSDYALAQAGISASAVRRWFEQQYGMTFHAYQRMLRVNAALGMLQSGTRAIDAAVDSGYESVSGFAQAFKRVTGQSPNRSQTVSTVIIERIATPLGPMFVGATDRGLCLLEFVDRRMLETELAQLTRRFKASIVAGSNAHSEQAARELGEYFAGRRTTFDVALDTPGTVFQQRVWAQLCRIPFGTTASYQDQARAIDRPTAMRAVAAANGANRVAIIIPCHRVIGKDGTLVGYGGGLERKRWLLDHEGALPAAPQHALGL